ncbi:hypothetical protein JD844_000110 [Phrynosoma platyrhinos]|uniref:Uncharacterized protein n=1 Tax=Phrynosoma platyrhinos TaxID=52577 RepID=A0ABQ7SQ37_PHRPL|nr:hypothetical protein JD844_000110 [Phrynosoma platyrhinos]
MASEGEGVSSSSSSSPGEAGGLLQQILSLRLVPPPGNLTGAACPTALCHFSAMAETPVLCSYLKYTGWICSAVPLNLASIAYVPCSPGKEKWNETQ